MSSLLDVDPLYSFPLCEQLSLEALILKGPQADRAFRQWINCVDFENIRFEATQLVPSLFDRFARTHTNIPHFPRLKGLYRLNFARNASLMYAAWHALVKLQEQGIEIIIFKGASLALQYYSGLSLRPMGDIDILVPAHQYELANAILQRIGWTYRHSEEIRHQVEHSTDYVNASGQGLDLHIRTLREVRDPAFDKALFERAHSFDWMGASFLMLSAEDEALITIVNAMREWDTIKLLWIQDLGQIIECNPALDWSKIWRRAEVFGLDKLVFHGMHIAINIRGLEMLHPIITECLSSSPNFELSYMREALANGLSYGISKGRVSHLSEITLSSNTAPVKTNQTNSSLELTDTKGPLGVIRIFETEKNIIKALYLQWAHLPLVPFFFKINDHLTWNEIFRQAPSNGEGIVEFRPGLLELQNNELPIEAYQIDIAIDQNLPSRMLPYQNLAITCSITNKSIFSWPLAGISKNFFGLSWHVFNADGTSRTWDNRREYLPPVMFARQNNIIFLKAGARLQSKIYFQAPGETGEYRIHFDVVHELIKWFSQTNESLPIWSLSVGTK